MSEDELNHRIRYVYSQLKAVADNLPKIAFDSDATAFNELVDELSELGFQAGRFRIANEDLFRPVASISGRSGVKKVTYQDSVQVRHGVFDRQVRALITYFELTQNNTTVGVGLPKREG